MEYEQFIQDKVKTLQNSGFTPKTLNKNLFPFQKAIVTKACQMGRYAIFADCGLGKTLMQLSWADQVVKTTKMPVLVLAPLAVKNQTIQEGIKFGIKVRDAIEHANVIDCGTIDDHYKKGVYIANYEQLDNIDISHFSGVVLDESSILKNFDGKLRNAIIDGFSDTPYKLACTATPSPNDPMELGNHAEFLNVMSRNQMLAMYFVHDGGQTSKWRLKKHAVSDFYGFVSTWAHMLSKPSDIGFDDSKYNLPPIHYHEYMVETPNNSNTLFNDKAVSATNFNKSLRSTFNERMDVVIDIVKNTEGQILIWVKQNQEGDDLEKMLKGYSVKQVKGSDKPEYKAKTLNDFANGQFDILITKAKIAQFGMNFQNCNHQIFASLDFSFEAFYQQVRRSYRFGQQKDVNIHIITTDVMQNVITSIKTKQSKFNQMQKMMNKEVNNAKHIQSSNVNEVCKGNDFTIQRGDCVKLIKNVPSESVGFSVFSPPFAELYTYSSHNEDMGNSKDYKEFKQHFKYLCAELFRVIKTGRNIAIHCMDLPIQKGKEGFIGLRDFSGIIRECMNDAGFVYHSRVTIWKNPVTEMQRTKALGLLHKQTKKDSAMSRVGIPDYLMIFRKDGQAVDPVHQQDTDPSAPNYLPVDLWQKYASPVWMDINYSNTLQYTTARDGKDEKHICPLQLDTIERAIQLWSNEGDIVLTPFMGIGSECFQALKMKRKAIGFELKESYFEVAKGNCNRAEQGKAQLKLF